MDRYGTGPGSFGAACWIPGVKTEKTAKKRGEKSPKWARYSHLKRVRVADLFVMDRYMMIGVGGRQGLLTSDAAVAAAYAQMMPSFGIEFETPQVC